MALVVFQHTSSEDAGRLGATLRDHGQTLDVRRLDLPLGGPTRNRHVPEDFDNVDGIITLGGVMNVEDDLPWMKPEMEFLREAHKRNLPVVGICLGAQLIGAALGGEVGPMDNAAEWGMVAMRQHPVANTDTILAGVPWTSWQFSAHGQEVKVPPPGGVAGVGGATVLQYSSKCRVQSFRAGLRTYGFQYHFEFDLPAMEGFFEGPNPLMSLAGTDPREGLAETRRLYEDAARVSDRLCVNLATYLFSVSRRIVA